MNSINIEGGCLCGAVRYLSHTEPSVVLNCHCSDCRKATGAPYVTWAVFPRRAIKWPGREPRRVRWAERLRLFCPDCGTGLGVLPNELADIVIVSVCTMDAAEKLTPVCDAWVQDKLPWVRLLDGMPHYAVGFSSEPVNA